MDEIRPAKPLYVTLLACLGWIGLTIPVLRRIWYVSQHDVLDEFPTEAEFSVFLPWFVMLIVLIVLDKSRRESGSEQRVWRIAAIPFRLKIVGLSLSMAVMVAIAVTGFGNGLGPVQVIGLIIVLLTGVLALVTLSIGLPAYTLFLTLRAIRAWRAYLRPA